MELEHQHERRLPNADPNSDGVANGHTSYPNTNANCNSNTYTSDANTNTGDTDANTECDTDLRTQLVVRS